MSQHALRRAAAHGVKNAMMAGSRHANEVHVVFSCDIQDRLYDIAVPKHDLILCLVDSWRCRPNMQKLHCDIDARQAQRKLPRCFNRPVWDRRMVDRHEHAPQPEVTGDLIDKSARAMRDKEGGNARSPEYRFGNRPLEPMVKPVPTVRRKDNQVAGVSIEEVNDLIRRRLLPAEQDIFYLYAKLGVDCSERIALIQEIPLHQQAPQAHMRMFPSLAKMILQNMQKIQFAPGRQCEAQRMGKGPHA